MSHPSLPNEDPSATGTGTAAFQHGLPVIKGPPNPTQDNSENSGFTRPYEDDTATECLVLEDIFLYCQYCGGTSHASLEQCPVFLNTVHISMVPTVQIATPETETAGLLDVIDLSSDTNDVVSDFDNLSTKSTNPEPDALILQVLDIIDSARSSNRETLNDIEQKQNQCNTLKLVIENMSTTDGCKQICITKLTHIERVLKEMKEQIAGIEEDIAQLELIV